jgi:hypothetical protein
MRKIFGLWMTVLGFLSFSSATLTAQLIVEIQYEGTVNTVGGSTTVAELGDTYQVLVRFPTNLSPVEVWGEEGAKYRAEGNSPLVEAHYTINGTTYSIPTSSYMDVSVSAPELSNSHTFFFEAFVTSSGSSGGFFLLQLDDPNRNALEGSQIPLSLNLESFSGITSTLFVGSEFVKGTVENFSYVTQPEPVPEPSIVSLLLLGSAAFMLKRWCRKNQIARGSHNFPI